MTYLRGMDISAYQPTVPSTAGQSFAFVKATEGTGYTSHTYPYQAAAVKTAGLVLVPYHYGAMTSGLAQANYFLNVAGKDSKIVLLDIETPPEIGPADAALFVKTCKSAGKTVGVYASASSFPMKLGQDFSFVAYPDGNGAPPPVRCEFWQDRSGVSGGDYFYGTMAQLRALAQLPVAAPVPPVPAVQLWDIQISSPTPVYKAASTTSGLLGTAYSMGAVATRQMTGGRWWYHITSARKFVGGHVVADGKLTATRHRP